MAPPNNKTDSTTEERLMELFQSRAVLKQEFNQMEQDKHLLTKISNEQAHRIEFLESDLKQLERLLTKAESYNDIRVYYQLRKVWNMCNRYIHKFRDRLVDQQRDRGRKQQLMEFNQNKTQKLKVVDEDVENGKKKLSDLVSQVEEYTHAINSKKYPWQFFTKQRLSKLRAIASKDQTDAYTNIQTLYDDRIKIESEPWPEFEGVSLAGKRSINLAMIALAQYFYMSLTDLGLATKTYRTNKKRPWESTYGTEAEQSAIIMKCQQKLELFSTLKDLGAEVQTRMTKLLEEIKYKKESDSIPDPDSIIKLINDISGTSLSATISDVSLEINVLTDGYWGLDELMIP